MAKGDKLSDKQAINKLAALKQICRHTRLSYENTDIAYPIFSLFVIADKKTTSIQKAAAAAILDLTLIGWRDSLTTQAKGLIVDRDDPAVSKWRGEVLKTSNFVCENCGSTHNLEAHHIIRWVDSPETRLMPENGMALCYRCHLLVTTGKLHVS